MTSVLEKSKINLQEAAHELVNKNVYLDMTWWVNYVVKQEDFWTENEYCPLTYSDIERKNWKKDDDDEEEEFFDYLCAYAVSDWLADELYEHGEFVARFDYLPNIWFRRTFGQMIICDGVIRKITRDWLVELGRCTREEADALKF